MGKMLKKEGRYTDRKGRSRMNKQTCEYGDVKPVREKEIRKSTWNKKKKKHKMISQFRLVVNFVFFFFG